MIAVIGKRKLVILLTLVFIVFLILSSSLLLKWMYPVKYESYVLSSSSKNGVDPFLVFAIIRAESKFNPGLTSAKGARGLMQIMPDTAEWIEKKGKFPDGVSAYLENPQINIEMGPAL